MEKDPLVIPPTRPHTHTVVFLHGRGDSARGFAASLSMSRSSDNHTLMEALPSVRWVFPEAPLRLVAAMASRGFKQRQWFDTWSSRNYSLREDLQIDGLREAVPALRQLLAEEAAVLGGRWDHVVLAGISMGGATAAHTLLNLDVPAEGGGRLGALVGFSSRCPFSDRSLAEMRAVLGVDGVPDHADAIQKTPVLLEFCTDDCVVPVKNGHMLRDALQRFGADVTWKEYPQGGHWFHSPTGIDDAIDFLKRRAMDLT